MEGVERLGRDVDVIHTGDAMFNKLFPFIDLDSGGSVDGYIAAQKKILALADEQTKIIPGHGPLASAADLRASIAIRGFRWWCFAGHARGATEAQRPCDRAGTPNCTQDRLLTYSPENE